MTPTKKTLCTQMWPALRLSLLGCATILTIGCVKPLDLPPMGDPLPQATRLEIAESIKGMVLHYTDTCGHPNEIPFGTRLEEALLAGARQTSKTVLYDGTGARNIAPDHLVRIDLVDWSFNLNKEALYDRAPATIKMNAIAQVFDMKGTVLRKTDIKVARMERLRLEQLARNCNYIIDPFLEDIAVEFASKIFLDARIALGGGQPQEPPTAPATGSAPRASSQLSSLKFKALLLDENGNLILEGGEHVRVRVDIVNTGPSPIQQASATLTGTASLLAQFPTATLAIPPLQPGETKSLEFMATLPQTIQSQDAEIHVLVTETGGGPSAPIQTLPLTIQPPGADTDSLAQIATSGSATQRPDTFLLSVGVGTYRHPKMMPRKHAAGDAAMVANYFQALGGVPVPNIRLLQDAKVRRLDIDEALFDWLPSRMSKDSTVIVYVSGQALVAPTGEIFFVPHEGSPTATILLYPLKELESALARLKAKQTILLFDGALSKLPNNTKAKPLAPRWEAGEGQTIRLIGGEGFTSGLEDDQHRHGLFTYYLLRGLRGEADTNRNGSVTLGELVGFVRQKVAWAAKTRFNSEQRPQILPPLKPDDPAASFVLSEPTSLAGTEAPYPH